MPRNGKHAIHRWLSRCHSCDSSYHLLSWEPGKPTSNTSLPNPQTLAPQSPLFVADALLSAAETQLSQELAVARADADSVRLVRSQLAAFRRDMEKEGQLQVGWL